MGHHTRAVILLGGWLLMYPRFGEEGKPLAPPPPPVDLGGGFTLQEQMNIPPVSESNWVQVSAHDTAKDCEQARAALVKKNGLTDDQGSKPPPHLLRGARCIPAESVYPPRPPAQK